MKRIYNGSIFDTDKAELMGIFEQNTTDKQSHYCEKLYCTSSGDYFIHGEGGPMSKYAVEVSFCEYKGGDNIKPVSEAEAKNWLEMTQTVK